MLPDSVNRRVKALKQLQLTQTNLESQFYQELHELEAKYYKQYETYYEKRNQIITGYYEPNDEECVWESSDDDEDSLSIEIKNKAQVKDESDENKLTENKEAVKKYEDENEKENNKGIPDFWLTIFKNVSLLSDMVQEHDEPILKHLYDIRTKYLDLGFILEFYFTPNEYFSNNLLTKEYSMRFKPDEKDPFSYEGPEIIKTKGCIIDWKKGKNVTLKIVKKNQKHKSKGSTRTVTDTVKNDSFFNFFDPPIIPEDDPEIDEDVQAIFNTDFEIGHYIRERIIHRAVLYYTGEILEDEDDEDYEEEEDQNEDEEEEEGEEDDNDNDFHKKAKEVHGQKLQPSECKQQ